MPQQRLPEFLLAVLHDTSTSIRHGVPDPGRVGSPYLVHVDQMRFSSTVFGVTEFKLGIHQHEFQRRQMRGDEFSAFLQQRFVTIDVTRRTKTKFTPVFEELLPRDVGIVSLGNTIQAPHDAFCRWRH